MVIYDYARTHRDCANVRLLKQKASRRKIAVKVFIPPLHFLCICNSFILNKIRNKILDFLTQNILNYS